MANKQSEKTVRYTKKPLRARAKKGGNRLASKALIKQGSSNLVPKIHVNRGDNVVVISGKDKGKIGKVIKIIKGEGKIIVEGVNIIKKHQKSMGPGRPGEIIESEAPIFASKVLHWDESKKKATRISKKILDNGNKVRIAKVSGEQLD